MNPTGYLLRWLAYLIVGVVVLTVGEKIPGWWRRTNAEARRRAKELE